MSDQMLHGALNAPYRLEDIDVVQFSNFVSAASRASIRIAELEAQLGTARADGYAAGVRVALALPRYQYNRLDGYYDEDPSGDWLAYRDVSALLPPDSEKGGAE